MLEDIVWKEVSICDKVDDNEHHAAGDVGSARRGTDMDAGYAICLIHQPKPQEM